ncbi:cartilage intermediate layer protein 1-like [Oculina patagonica]
MAVNCGFLLLVLALCSGFAVLRAQGERCDQGWNFYGGNCYFREDSKAAMTTWEMAQKICETKQANLVTVNDASEQKFLEGILGERGSWCGLNNKDNQKELKWVSGEKSDYTNWAPNQPSKSNRRRCVHIQVASDNHKWVMQRCTRQFRFTCEKAASPLKPCAASPCQNGGTCIEQGAGYKCQCPVKFTGNNCETPIVINPCDSNPCLNGGTCTATGNGYSCQCPDKFTGKNCEQSLDACSPNPCMNGGQCYDTGNNKYLCVCVGAFKGDNCEKVDCDKWPCKNGGTCLELGDKAFCKCPSGFTGATCEGVVPSITQDPQDKTGLEGDEVTLCCKAEGTPAPKYQWFHKDAPLKESSSSLRLSSLSTDDAGSYRCRATNDFGSMYSSEANVKVIPGSGDDSCDPTPKKKVQTLPPGCTEDSSGSNSVNVGTCSYESCIKRGEGGGCGGQGSTRKCCSPAAMSDSAVSCGNGIKFTIQKVTKCACADCAVPKIVVRGKAVDPVGNPVKKGEITVGDGGGKYSTDLSGNFKIPVKSGTTRLVLTIRDKLQGLLMDTTKAFTIHEGQVSFYTIVLQKKPPVKKFKANEKQKIPLGGSDGKPSFVDIDIPANSFVTADGSIYNGEITANVGVVDPRTEAGIAAAPGDFSAIDENGEEVMLGNAGILRQVYTDDNGRQLGLAKNITVRIDAEQLDIPPGVTVAQWYLSQTTGRWVKFGELRLEERAEVSGQKRQARKFFVGEITPDVPKDNINWDYVATASRVRIRAPPGTVVTRIGLSDNGQQYTSYRQETVPASGVLCMLTLRNKQAILQAELNGAPLIPQRPVNFPAAVNPQIIERTPAGTLAKIQSFQFTSTKADDSGPVYLKGEEGRCAQDQAGDKAFEFESAGGGQLFHWESPRIDVPTDPRFWDVRADEICFVKALVTGSRPGSVIYVKSTGKARGQPVVDYGYTAEKAAMVGSSGVVCLEYRCNEGPQAAYQTHLQVLTLTGTCTIQSLNSVLDGRQGQCPVSPDGSSSRERNFCVPKDLVGGDAGLYTGDSAVARNRCITGNNQYSSGRPVARTTNPTVTLNCS